VAQTVTKAVNNKVAALTTTAAPAKPAVALAKPAAAQAAVAAKPAILQPTAAAKPAAAAPVSKLQSPAAVVKLGTAPIQSAAGYTSAATKTNAAAAPAAAASAAAVSGSGTDAGTYASGDGPVIVDIQRSDSGYENKIYWSSDNWQTRNYLGVYDHTASINLGSFKAGTKIEFGIDNGNGDFFKTGGAAVSSDNFQHTRVQNNGGVLTVGFEDLRGGGDRDFNDAIITVRGLSRAAQSPVAPPLIAAPSQSGAAGANADPGGNRSGLMDGTNPGNGAGRVNSPNQGTNNPNQAPANNTANAAKPVIPAPAASVAKPAVAPAPAKAVTVAAPTASVGKPAVAPAPAKVPVANAAPLKAPAPSPVAVQAASAARKS
jgi:hypothetical protein